jgi:hypothetical protein
MFDGHHYLPVLRWKKGEWSALRTLVTEDRQDITPILELPPSQLATPRRIQDSPGQLLLAITERISTAWGNAPILVDLKLLPRAFRIDGAHPWLSFAQTSRAAGLSVIPTISPASSASERQAILEVARADRRGICIRIPYRGVGADGIGQLTTTIARELNCKAEDTNLIIDYGYVESSPNYSGLLARIPRLTRWRTLTILSGAFPENLARFSVGNHSQPRHDWNAWSAQLARKRARLPRCPAYGDYTTQHAEFREPVPGANPTASIRYTTDDHWLIMRGEGLRNENGPGHAQYPGHAMLLRKRAEYCGPGFSAGDKYVSATADNPAHPGNATTWLSAGVNHHLVFAARQLASLFAS